MLGAVFSGGVFHAPAVAGGDAPNFALAEYAGTGSSHGIDTSQNISADGGMVLVKNISSASSHSVFDTIRGVQKFLQTNANSPQTTTSAGISSYNTDGFTIELATAFNASGEDYAAFSWVFAESFFEAVTYSGTGSNRTIAHSLSVPPRMIWVKCSSGTGNWRIYHVGMGATHAGTLDGNNAFADNYSRFNDTEPTSTVFSLGFESGSNGSGNQYVAYLFAEQSGKSKIDSYTADGTDHRIELGFRPKAFLVKDGEGTGDWYMAYDAAGGVEYTKLNTTAAGVDGSGVFTLDSSGITIEGSTAVTTSGRKFVYAAWA